MGLSAAGAAAISLLLPTGLLGVLPASPAGPGSGERASRAASPYVMVSVDDRGRPADDDVVGASVSRDGRWVAFSSRAQNFDRRTGPGAPQVFLRDNRTGRVRAVGADGRGRLAHAAETVSLSPSGRFVAFCSSDDLVGPDTFDPGVDTVHTDVFVRDLRTGKVRRASTARGGGEGDDYSCVPDVADTGDVAFFSRATNLVAGDVNGVPDYFLYDWGSRRVRRLATAEIASGSVRLSGDGRVAGVVTTEVLAARDSGALPDVYVLRRGRGLRGSWSMPLTQGGGLPTDTGCGWTGLSLSRTGRFVTGACADGGIATTPIADKPVHLWWTDRRTGNTRLVNRTTDVGSEIDAAQVSDDGRRVFFAGRERDYARSAAARADYQGVFLWQRGDGVRALTRGDAWWDAYGFDAAGDGRTVVFTSSSEAMGAPPPVLDDADLQLFARRVGRSTPDRRLAARDARAPSWALVDGNGVAPDAHTTDGSISRTGRWMVFATMATNLGRPRRDVSDAYLRDNRTGRVRPVAVFGRRERVARSSLAPAISPSGRFVAFCSPDPRIVRPDSFVVRLQADHPDIDVFVRDLRTGAVRRASTDRRGREANDYSCAPEVADTGDVVFESQATDLVRRRLGGDPGDRRVYLYDWSSDRVHLLADEPSDHAISADGRTLVATVGETLLASDDLPGTDAYVLRRPRRGERLGTWRIYDPERPAGATTDGCAGTVDVTGNGEWFAATCSSGLGSEAGLSDKRAFRFHRRTGRSVMLDPGPPGHLGPLDLSLSDDGRTVAIAEPAYPLVAATADSDAPDVMIWRQGSGLSLWTAGHDAWWDHYGLEVSGDGSTLVFSSRSDAMSPDDLNGEHQVDLFLSRLE